MTECELGSDCWYINHTKKLKKQIAALPPLLRTSAFALLDDLEVLGPRLTNWPNYSTLVKRKKTIPDNAHHCHLRGSKRPTYVACWCVIDAKQKNIEVFYVGTHEKAPY